MSSLKLRANEFRAVASLQYSKVDAGMINASAFAVLTRRSTGVRILADPPRTRQRTKGLTGLDPNPRLALFLRSESLNNHPAAAQQLTRHCHVEGADRGMLNECPTTLI